MPLTNPAPVSLTKKRTRRNPKITEEYMKLREERIKKEQEQRDKLYQTMDKLADIGEKAFNSAAAPVNMPNFYIPPTPPIVEIDEEIKQLTEDLLNFCVGKRVDKVHSALHNVCTMLRMGQGPMLRY